jgi:hypothetical protein
MSDSFTSVPTSLPAFRQRFPQVSDPNNGLNQYMRLLPNLFACVPLLESLEVTGLPQGNDFSDINLNYIIKDPMQHLRSLLLYITVTTESRPPKVFHANSQSPRSLY